MTRFVAPCTAERRFGRIRLHRWKFVGADANDATIESCAHCGVARVDDLPWHH